jgi:thiol:disulfide interchange protein
MDVSCCKQSQASALSIARRTDTLHERDRIGTSASTEYKRRAFLFGGLAIAGMAMTVGFPDHARAMTTRIGPVRSVPNYLEAVSFAGVHNRFAVIDVAAEWCAFCHVLDKKILVDPRVVAVLAELAVIRVDVTAMDPANINLLAHLNVLGPPTLFVVDTSTGREVESTRSVGAFDVANLLGRLRPLVS